MGAQAEAALTSIDGFGALPLGWDLPRAGSLTLSLPPGWDLRRVALSHGWSALAPCAWNANALHRTLLLPDAGALTVRIAGSGRVSWGRPVTTQDRNAIRAQVARMLCLRDDLSELHAVAPPWVGQLGMGRMLRSPTVWEDLARTLATTNCSWSLTDVIVSRLCWVLGAHGPCGERAFPTPEAVAAAGEDLLREEIRVGYRARAFTELAQKVAEGSVQPEQWLDPAISDDELTRRLLGLRGFGPYAAENMLGLLGRPKGFALDSWIRARLPTLLGRSAMSDAQIKARYEPYGRWAGTVLWCELTRDW